MDAPNPPRQVALIREARSYGNLGKVEFPIPNHFDRTPQSQGGMRSNDVSAGRFSGIVDGLAFMVISFRSRSLESLVTGAHDPQMS
jgi:hypothetical protein